LPAIPQSFIAAHDAEQNTDCRHDDTYTRQHSSSAGLTFHFAESEIQESSYFCRIILSRDVSFTIHARRRTPTITFIANIGSPTSRFHFLFQAQLRFATPFQLVFIILRERRRWPSI